MVLSSSISVRLSLSELQQAALLRLRSTFVEACNELAPLVREQRCWSRVALHHMAYRQLRSCFPELGSQMVCNVIHAVCRSARLVYQHPESPWCVSRLAGRPLPLLNFSQSAPVYFDRHTLSLRKGGISLFTLGGRALLSLDLPAELELRFAQERVREIMLNADADGFYLVFLFAAAEIEQQEIMAFPAHVSALLSD